MVKVRTVERQISLVEKFDVRIHFSGPGRERGRDVRSDRQDLPSYDYRVPRTGSVSVAEWRTNRFEKRYPGLTAVVLNGSGQEVDGHTLLATVRATYEHAG